jgi:hypothetical protein
MNQQEKREMAALKAQVKMLTTQLNKRDRELEKIKAGILPQTFRNDPEQIRANFHELCDGICAACARFEAELTVFDAIALQALGAEEWNHLYEAKRMVQATVELLLRLGPTEPASIDAETV